MYDSIVNAISNFTIKISNFFEQIVNFVWYLVSIVKTLRYWLTSLLSASFDLFKQVFEWEAITTTITYFWKIAEYIWGPATTFLASLFIIIILRIWIAFVFKLFRLNIDYNSFDKNTRKANAWDRSSEYHKKQSTRV